MTSLVTAIGRRVVACAVLPMLVALAACAERSVNHGFSFGNYGENQGIEILNYRYGESNQAFTHADKGYLVSGHIPQSDSVHGFFPVGNSLYVKWRVLSTGRVYEDVVDLRSREPLDMNNKQIHFLIKGSQLYVYVIFEGKGHFPSGPECPVRGYRDFGCEEVYPTHWQNI